MKNYITTEGDSWDSIAKKLYDSEFYADFLMQNNIDKIDIYIFPSGIELKTPEIPENMKATNNLPEWRLSS